MVINGDYDSPYLMIHEFSGSIGDFSGCQCQVSRLCDMTLEARSVWCFRCWKMVVLKKWIKTFVVRKSHINLHKSHDYPWFTMDVHLINDWWMIKIDDLEVRLASDFSMETVWSPCFWTSPTVAISVAISRSWSRRRWSLGFEHPSRPSVSMGVPNSWMVIFVKNWSVFFNELTMAKWKLMKKHVIFLRKCHLR